MLHHPALVPEFENAFPEIVCGFSVLPAEIRDRQFDVEITDVRDPSRGTDDQGTFAKKESFKNLCGIKTLPAGARMINSEIDIGQTHAERGVGQTILGELFAKISWISSKENAGSCLKDEKSYQQVAAAKDRISGVLL